MKNLKKKKNFFFFFFEIGIFFFKLGKKSPKSHWERGRISAPEDTKKNPWFANNKGADQTGHQSNLISTVVIHLMETIISKPATHKISIF